MLVTIISHSGLITKKKPVKKVLFCVLYLNKPNTKSHQIVFKGKLNSSAHPLDINLKEMLISVISA